MEAIERETYINFSDAEDTATLCTFNRAWLNRMDKLAAKSDDVQVKIRRENYGEYLFPKKLVAVKTPRITSEKERTRLSEHARNVFHSERKDVDHGNQ